MVFELRNNNGDLEIYQEYDEWSHRFPLPRQELDLSDFCDGREFKMYGINHRVSNPSNRPARVILWSAIHVHSQLFGGKQFYDFRAQTNVIRHVRPEVVLHEFFGDALYDPRSGTCRHHGVQTGIAPQWIYAETPAFYQREPELRDVEVSLAVRLADTLSHTLVGCDSNPHSCSPERALVRETEQALVISQFQGTPERPSIAIIGGWHTSREGSHLLRKLSELEVPYAVIRNVDYEREFAPSATFREHSTDAEWQESRKKAQRYWCLMSS